MQPSVLLSSFHRSATLLPMPPESNQTPLFQTLQSMTRRALQPGETQALLEFVAAQTTHALKLSGCAILSTSQSENRIKLLAATGLDPKRALPALSDLSLISTALTTGMPALASRGAAEVQQVQAALSLGSEPSRAACVCIAGEVSARGALLVWSDGEDEFEASAVLFLQGVAGILSGIFARRRAEKALLESKAKAQAVLETTVDAIITIDARGKIESFNKAAERIFGYAAREVMGKNVEVLMPEPYRSEHDDYLEAYHTTGRRKIIGIGREVTGRRKDGTVFPMYLAVSEVPLQGRKLFTGIVRNITEQRRLEQEVLRMSEDERRRIGQDLHDGLGQMLTGIGLITSNLARQMQRDEIDLAGEIAEVAEMVKEADRYARGLAHGLVPVELEQGGLRGALERLAQNAARLFGIRCTFEERGSSTSVDTTTAMHLYRIAQEAVSNAVRHGKASEVNLLLDAGTKYLRLRIRDNGVGFTDVDLAAPPEALEELRGMGVRIMHYRARIIGATLEIQGVAGVGTTITCTLRKEIADNKL